MHLLSTRLTILCGFLFINFSNTTILSAQDRVKGEIEMEERTRKYRLYIPSSYTADQAMPLVFNLHGLTSDAGQQELYTQMNEVAEENGFIVCYPKGHNRAWNVGFNFPTSKAADVKFISELIDHLALAYAIDLNRVYACGFSNGGYMSHKLACELSDKIVAIASVAGTFVPGEEENCEPSRAVPVMQIHGTADPIVRYNGFFEGISATETIDFWRTKNNCLADYQKTKVSNTVKLDFSKAVRYDFGDCMEETAVVLYKVKNGGHTWPGASLILGVTNKDFSASEEIWHFFKQFSFEVPSRSRNSLPVSTGFQLMPNPTFENLTIALNLSKPTTLSRGLYSLQGQTVLGKETAHFPTGKLKWNYDLQGIPMGIYFLRLYFDGEVITRKVIVKQ